MMHYLNTGQRLCYDTAGRIVPCRGSGQDAETAPGRTWPLPRFRWLGKRIADRLTGLEWLRDANRAEWPMPWNEALEWVEGANRDRLAGCDDWRLPNRGELRSLISYQTRNPALPEDHPFEQVHPGWYWSSTPFARNTDYAWYVQFSGGRAFFGRKVEDHMVWPCRGKSRVLPGAGRTAGVAPRFLREGGWVNDRLTGLVWTRSADVANGEVTWDEAIDAAAALHLAGRSWRLPTLNELESLVDTSRWDPALPEGHPFENVGDGYWSSTTSAFEPDWCMAVYFGSGAVGVGQKKGKWFHVWAVACGRDRAILRNIPIALQHRRY
jgi:hypothetical protein